jgi:UDP-N-acetylglucosamine 4,6-dehydratase
MLNIIGRNHKLFVKDLNINSEILNFKVSNSKFLVLGGAGSIGQAVVKEIFKRNPLKLHVVDISENNLVELVRDIRSSFGYLDGEFKTYALDIGSLEYDSFFNADGKYDYVLNLSALKHVRSEKDSFTLMRMINVNILNTKKTLDQCIKKGVYKYFCVSTDKAANPVNMMGASKKIMEMFVHRKSKEIKVSMARFANVAFSDGSLLHGFKKRIEKSQPIVAPIDVKRYFIIPEESGELCLMSCIFGENRDIFFPKLNKNLNLISFSDIALKFLKVNGLNPLICDSEDDARVALKSNNEGFWPCLFSESDTTGEKNFEEFYTLDEVLDFNRFENIGIIKNDLKFDLKKLNFFEKEIINFQNKKEWSKSELVDLFRHMLPNFEHIEKGKNLDSKM